MSETPHTPTEPVHITSAERAGDAGSVPSVGGNTDATHSEPRGLSLATSAADRAQMPVLGTGRITSSGGTEGIADRHLIQARAA